jgi:hypothetical protein
MALVIFSYGPQGLCTQPGSGAIRHQPSIDSSGQRQRKDRSGAGFSQDLCAFVQRRTGGEDIIHEENAFFREVLWPPNFKCIPKISQSCLSRECGLRIGGGDPDEVCG